MVAATKVARRAKFESVFAKIRDELVEHLSEQGTPHEAVEWYRNVRTRPLILLNIPWLITRFFFLLRASSTIFVAVNSFVACPSSIPWRFS